jgi:hypothetical protein
VNLVFYCIKLMAEREEVVFVVGGHIGDEIWIASLDRYDNASASWLDGASMITVRSCFGLCEVGGMLYATGGFDAGGNHLVSVECYNPILDSWSAGPAPPRSFAFHRSCAVGDTMYMLGDADNIYAEV